LNLRARLAGKPYEQKVTVRFPAEHEEGEAIGTLWARARIEDLSNQQIGGSKPELKEEITRVALAHRLVSAYTSFVAVEEQIVTGSEQPVLVEVPVEMPDGVSYEGIFGGEASASMAYLSAAPGRPRAKRIAPALIEGLSRSPMAPAEPKSEPRRIESHGSALTCRIEAVQKSYQLSQPLEIVVAFENLSGKTMEVPAILSTVDGTARFQILDSNWKASPHPTPNAAKPNMLQLQPGARITLSVIINGAGGYSITKPGTYHIVFLGAEIGLPNSNTLTIRVDP
jgi:hypothetical protein